eukprot:637007-Prorocentrum_minimum.AAC.2
MPSLAFPDRRGPITHLPFDGLLHEHLNTDASRKSVLQHRDDAFRLARHKNHRRMSVSMKINLAEKVIPAFVVLSRRNCPAGVSTLGVLEWGDNHLERFDDGVDGDERQRNGLRGRWGYTRRAVESFFGASEIVELYITARSVVWTVPRREGGDPLSYKRVLEHTEMK